MVYQWRVNLPRDQHLAPAPQKRILSLDGGGIRGLLTCGILQHVETTLAARLPEEQRDSFVLSDYFDFICGTSTGSIVAAWLALGKKVSELAHLYETLGGKIFSEPRMLGRIIVSRFDGNALDAQLAKHLGDASLDSTRLKTGFGVTAKRMDSGSAWLLSNNPRAPYWESRDGSFPNSDYRLRDVVRASAAAPAYFDHVDVQIEPGRAPGAFMDGAVAGLNNPALAFFKYVAQENYGLNWSIGADQMLIVSVGTGRYREQFSSRSLNRMSAIKRAVFSLSGSISNIAEEQTKTMQALGYCIDPVIINSEVGTSELLGKENALFQFQRYDAPLDREGLCNEIDMREPDGQQLGPRMIKNLQKLDCANAENLRRLREIGDKAGELYVKDTHFPAKFDIPGMTQIDVPTAQPEISQETPANDAPRRKKRGLFRRRR